MNLDASHGRAAASLSLDRGHGDTVGPAHERAMRALAQIGFVQPADCLPNGQVWRWRGEDAAGDRALLRLLAAFDLQLEIGPAADGVAWIALAMRQRAMMAQDQAYGNEVFAGSGFRPDEAVRSCLGEVAEFQSWLHRPGDGVKRCTKAALGELALEPWTILGFTRWQRDRRAEFNIAWAGYESIPEATSFDGETDWSPVERLSDGRTHWLPTQLCHGRYPGVAWRSDSNGCAAGRSAEIALSAATHELVERDAAGIWWYGRCPRPGLDTTRLGNEELRTAIAGRAGRGELLHLLDLTHDLGVPVAACVLLDPHGRLLAMGFGCKAQLGAAAAAAYLEMCQVELSIAFARRRTDQLRESPPAEDCRLLAWLGGADLRRFPHLAPDAQARPCQPHANQSMADVIARLGAAGLHAYRLNLQRPEIGIPVVRVFVPGLCHYKPRLGHARLVEVPKRLGWQGATFSAEDLSSMPLLI